MTGSLRSAWGPKNLLGLCLFGLLCFLILHFIYELLSLGWTPDQITQALFQYSKLGERRSMLFVLELIHMDFFLLSMMWLFLASILLHFNLAKLQKQIYFFSISALVLLYPLSKLMSYFLAYFSVIVWLSGLALYLALLSTILYSLYFLYFTNKKLGA